MVVLELRNAKCMEGNQRDEQIVKYDNGLTVKVTNIDAMTLYTLIEDEVNRLMDGKFRITTDSPIDEIVSVDLNRTSIIIGLRRITTSLSSGTYDGKLVMKTPPGESKRMKIFEIHKLDETDIAKRRAGIEAEMQKGHDNFAKGAFRDAAYYFSRTKGLDPNYIDGEWHVGKTFLAEGDYPGAIKKFKEIISKSPDRAEFYYDLAMAYANTSKYDLMMENLRQSVHLTTDENRKGEIEMKITEYDTSMEKEYFTSMRKADAYRLMGDIDKAINTYENVTDRFPEKEKPHFQLAIIYSLIKKDYDHAIEHVSFIRQKDSNNPQYLLLLSQLYMSTGRLNEAIDTLSRAKDMNLGLDATKRAEESMKSLGAMKGQE